MLFEEALDVLTDVKSTVAVSSAVLADATRTLQSADDAVAVEALGRIALNPGADASRREAAFVLLRSRLLAWHATSAVKSGIEEGLMQCLWSSQTDAGIAWRVCSVISGVLCGNDQWPRLTASVLDFLAIPQPTIDQLYIGLDLIKAIFTDGLPEHVTIPMSSLSRLLSLGLSTESGRQPSVQKVAYQALDALLESFVFRPDTPIPPECQELFVKLMDLGLSKLQDHHVKKTNKTFDHDLDDIIDVLTSIVSAVDNRGALRLRRTRVWNNESVAILFKMMDLAHAKHWVSELRQDESKITQQVCQIATSACLSEKGSVWTENLWKFLLDHLALEYRDDLNEIAVGWELQRDDEDSPNDLELADGTVDLTVVAWEQLERLIKGLDDLVCKRLVQPYVAECFSAASLDLKANYGRLYSAWMVWAIYLGVKKPEGENEDRQDLRRIIFNQWQGSAQLTVSDSSFDAYQTARIRWAALLFMNEALETFGEKVVDSKADLIRLVELLVRSSHAELVPRVKAKCYLTFCQLLGDLDLSQEESFALLLKASFEQSLLPKLSSPAMLPQCKSVVSGQWSGDQATAMEVSLQELVICSVSSCMPHLGPAGLDFYVPVFTFCQELLARITVNPEMGYIAEAALDLASRSIDCAGVLCIAADEAGDDRNEQVIQSQLARVEADSIYLLDKIVELNEFVTQARPSMKPSAIKSGLHAQSFERTLLQSAARALTIAPVGQVKSQVHYLLRMIVKKLIEHDTFDVTDVNDRQPVKDDSSTTVIVSSQRGPSKRININTTLIEEQIEGLNFIGITASRIWDILMDNEADEIINLMVGCIRQTSFALVRKAGVEALKEICDHLATKFKQIAETLPSVVGQGLKASPLPFLSNAEFFNALKMYLHRMRQGMEVSCDVLLKTSAADLSEDESVFYAFADMCEGARDAASLFGGPLTKLDEPMQQALGVDAFSTMLDDTFSRVLASLTSLSDQRAEIKQLGDDDEADDDTDYYGLRCDAAMQLTSRLAKAFGHWVSEPFNKYLKTFFANILATEDVSVVARTAGLCVLANYLEAAGVEANKAVPAADLLPVALLYCRAQPMDPSMANMLKQYIPQYSDGKPPYSVEENDLHDLACALRLQTGSCSSEIVSEFLEPYRMEYMKIQAACYCVGAACLYAPSIDIIMSNLPRIDQTFADLLDHPLAALTSRRVIIDCLCNASLKIFTRLPMQAMHNSLRIFNYQGLLQLLQTCFPLTDDQEDAAYAHDILIDLVLDGPKGAFFSLAPQENIGTNGLSPALIVQFKQTIFNILSEVKKMEPGLLSLSARVGGRLDNALHMLNHK